MSARRNGVFHVCHLDPAMQTMSVSCWQGPGAADEATLYMYQTCRCDQKLGWPERHLQSAAYSQVHAVDILVVYSPKLQADPRVCCVTSCDAQLVNSELQTHPNLHSPV